MFNNQKNPVGATKQMKKPDITRDAAVTILTSGCHFSGKLFCRGSTRIGGCIDGEIISEGLLIIEEEAKINASIKVDEVVIQGRVDGKLEAAGRVELTASSAFSGDILTPVLVIREGAQFNGRSKMLVQQQHAESALNIGQTPEIEDNMDVDVNIKEVAMVGVPEITAQ